MLRRTLQRLQDLATLRFRKVGIEVPLADVIAGARAGQRPCLGELYRRYRATVVGFLTGLTPTDAAAITQEVFISLAPALATYREGDNFESWIKKVAFSVYRTKHSANRGPEEDWDARVPPSPLATLGRTTTDDLSKHALDGMPTVLREAWVLHREGYETQDIATALAVTPRVAATRLARARDFLRQHLTGLT